jgi:hypothetical protein
MTTPSPTTSLASPVMRKRFHTKTSAVRGYGQDRPTLSVFDNNATLTGDVAAVRQMLPGVWGDSSS